MSTREDKPSRRERKKEAFRIFKKKWGLSGYNIYSVENQYDRFSQLYLNGLYIYHSSCTRKPYNCAEIKSVDTFIRRLRSSSLYVIIDENEHSYEVYSEEELKEHMLIRKLSGI